MSDQFSNKAIVDSLVPLSSEVSKRMLEKHVRPVGDVVEIQKAAYTFLEQAHQKALSHEIISQFKAFIKEIQPKYLENLYAAFDTLEAKVEGEGATRERNERCVELSLWVARYIAENPSHSEDDGFLDIIARELAGKCLGGMPRLDLELTLSMIKGSYNDYMDMAFKHKFGKTAEEVDLDDIQEILTEAKENLKEIPKEQ